MTSSGTTDFGGERLVGVGDPTNDDHAATKKYVDDNSGGGGGGSSPSITSFPFAHDTPGLVDGVTILSLADQQILLALFVSLPVAFDGTTPVMWVGTDDNPAILVNTDATVTDSPPAPGLWYFAAGSFGTTTIYAHPAVDLKLYVTNGNVGGNPGSTVGAGEVYMLTAPVIY